MLLSKQGQRKVLNLASCQRISAVICLSLLAFGCESHKLTQCEQVFSIARDVNQSSQDFDDFNNEQSPVPRRKSGQTPRRRTTQDKGFSRMYADQDTKVPAGDRWSKSMKSWLEAANKFSQAADKMRALKVDHRELIQYQNQLVRIYRIYAQTTYDAVRARENNDLPLLESARNDAIQAGIIQRQLIQEINTYCLEAE